MNELAMIFDGLGIPTREMLRAPPAQNGNFLPFTPGLIGGHCISVGPYYLTARAKAAGWCP
jgi:UDP-N-acetyl-D-glucosamine/UDP-N-acetyl-D-galactosamine dehydrogenase